MVSKNELTRRITNAQNSLNNIENSILLVTPGPNLRYLTDYKAKNLERLTCLAISKDRKPILVVPELEKLAALGAGIDENIFDLVTWKEGSNPYDLFNNFEIEKVFIDEKMTADKVLAFQNVFNKSIFINASKVMTPLRSVKSDYEIEELKNVGKMIDLVHDDMSKIIQPGMAEIEVSKKIGNKILEVGHETVDFVIVASGNNFV